MSTSSQSSVALYFARAFPARTASMVVLMIAAGLAEGVSLVALLPLLQLVADGQSAPSGAVAEVVAFLATFGVEPTLEHLLPVVVAGMTVKALFLWFAMRQVGYTVARVATELRLDLIESILHAKWRHFTGRPKGQVANSISNEAQRASAAYRDVCTMLAKGVQVILYAGLAVFVSWQAAIIALVSGLGLLMLLRGFLAMSKAAGQQQTAAMSSLSRRLVDALQGIKSVKAMAAESNLLQLLRRDAEDLNESHQKLVSAAETLKLLQEPLVALLVAAGLWLTLIVLQMPFADAIVLALLFHRVMGQTTTMQQHYVGVMGGESAFWSIRSEIESAQSEREELRGGRPAPSLNNCCVFDRVSFGYNGARVIDDLTFEVPAGSFIAIVGSSGAGKTTLADLLLGLHVPTSGRILVDNVPLSQIDMRSWRRSIGYVPQDTTLFHDTVLANVTLGDPSFSEDDVIAALDAAGALSFVRSRADGIMAIVGEQGQSLSGGQRQRIAIARALIRRPRLLVLDEATAALDPDTERQICATLRDLKGALTIVAISHQSGIQDVADAVYRLDGGHIGIRDVTHVRA